MGIVLHVDLNTHHRQDVYTSVWPKTAGACGPVRGPLRSDAARPWRDACGTPTPRCNACGMKWRTTRGKRAGSNKKLGNGPPVSGKNGSARPSCSCPRWRRCIGILPMMSEEGRRQGESPSLDDRPRGHRHEDGRRRFPPDLQRPVQHRYERADIVGVEVATRGRWRRWSNKSMSGMNSIPRTCWSMVALSSTLCEK